MKWFRRLLCRFGKHKRLDVIQDFGSGQHVGCPDCGAEFGVHHGARAFLPWDGELEDLYTRNGYDVPKARCRWRAYRFGGGAR